MAKVDLLLMKVKHVDDPADQFEKIQVDELSDYYKHLECDTFDIVTRKIGDKYYDVFCDDCGLFDDDPIVSMTDQEGHAMMVGNLIFANHDSQGNTTSLTDEDMRNIKRNAHIGLGDGRVIFRIVADY